MDFLKYFIISVVCIYFLIIFIMAARSKKIFKFLTLNLTLGLSTFFILYLTKRITGIILPLNTVTAGTSILFGVPGVIGILLLNLIF